VRTFEATIGAHHRPPAARTVRCLIPYRTNSAATRRNGTQQELSVGFVDARS